jgi:trimethylamine--corrinoid protein Co-methyltransferase
MTRPVFLDGPGADTMHRATLAVLQDTGIYLDCEEAESLYLSAGAKKDGDGRILLPPTLIEDALRGSTSTIEIWERDAAECLLLGNGRTYFGPGSDALYNVDRDTGEIRRSTLRDIAENACIVDALPHLSFVMSMALPQDVPPRILYASAFAEMARNTTKPLIATATSTEEIRQIHAVASIIAGGPERLRRRPFFLAYLEPISPLRLDRSAAERVLYCAEQDIPIIFAAGANCGSGAPITPEAGVVQGGAESLAGLVLALLKNENAKFVYGSNTSSLDMATSIVSYGAPEWYKTVAMYADMGGRYHLPTWGTAGCTDALSLDAQAAMEAYEGILMAQLAGTTLAHDVGFLAHGTLYDARMLVLTDEMIRRARHLLKPVDLSCRILATDVIDEVARSNDLYIAHPHTAEHFREALWLPPSYINRRSVVAAEAEGALGAELAGRVAGILSSHRPKPLPADTLEKVDAYLRTL